MEAAQGIKIKVHRLIVTTSWDDGNKLDFKLAALLDKYNLKGTFYIPKDYDKTTLQDSEIKKIGGRHEVGAHTLSHPRIWKMGGMSRGEKEREISGSKQYLEEILGEKIKMFCYPYGKFTEEIKALVKEAGFLGARTTKDLQIYFPDDFFEFGITLRVLPLSFWQNLRFFRWPRLARSLFNRVLKNGQIYHLWGHSWEIEKYGMWEDLEEIFKYIANRENVLYLTNSQALQNTD